MLHKDKYQLYDKIIDATHTEICQKIKIETTRQDTIAGCTKMTTTLIKESEEKLFRKTRTLETIISTKIENKATKMMESMTFFQVSFQLLENYIAILKMSYSNISGPSTDCTTKIPPELY